MLWALGDVLGQPVVAIWHKDDNLQNCDFIIVPGGFSYGDYLRSGAIAVLSPVMKAVKEHADKGGQVLGICNGFQILCEAGLLPGTLLKNDHQKYTCKEVYLKVASNETALTAQLDAQKSYLIPIAHGEGRYYANEQTIQSLKQNDQIMLQYCDAAGNVTAESNPNGSLLNIAGICNKERNVMGLMPHPERAAHQSLGNTDGLAMLKSLLNTETEPAV